MEDIDKLWEVADNFEGMGGKTICALADAAAWPTKSYIEKFREEFEEHVRLGRCPLKG
jgi:NADH-quinone oxidoreductase subunit F